MRTLPMIPVSGMPSTSVVSACPPPAAGVELLPALAAVAAPQWSAVVARPSGRGLTVAAGYGYAGATSAAAWKPGVGRERQAVNVQIVNVRVANVNVRSDRGTTSTTSTKLQDQFHLMSRRDHRTWRPPA